MEGKKREKKRVGKTCLFGMEVGRLNCHEKKKMITSTQKPTGQLGLHQGDGRFQNATKEGQEISFEYD